MDSKEILDAATIQQNRKNNLDMLIFYIMSCEFIFLLLKLIAKLIKLIIDLTQINLKKPWNKRLFVFNFISFCRYAVKLFIEIVIIFNLN
jgi:hypothetical protein